MDLAGWSVPASADTGRFARTVDLAPYLSGGKIWTAETIPHSKRSVTATFRGSEFRQHRSKAALGNGQPALRAGSQGANYAVFFAITEPCSQLIWTAMGRG